METTVPYAIAALSNLNIPTLKTRYRELFGEESRSSNREFLRHLIAWRLQAQAEGDLSERARRRITEIADDKDLRVRAPKSFCPGASQPPGSTGRGTHDFRLPRPGTELRRRFENRDIVVKVLANGYEYEHHTLPISERDRP